MHLCLSGRQLPRAACALVLITLSTTSLHAQIGSSSSNVGYIDSAIPADVLRFRVDAAYNINRPDRAEYLYYPGFDSKIDYQDPSMYLEMALTPQFSGFVELHGQFVNPLENPNAAGLGDMNLGVKWAFFRSDDQIATFQMRVYIPTGNPELLLGNAHVSLEPALLFYQQLTDRLTLEGEFRDWIPVGATDVAGNILRYGVGLSYSVLQNEHFRIAPVVEFVGWTVLEGKESIAQGVFQNAAGDEIINAKIGLRLASDSYGDVYLGYGRSLTGDVWYKNLYSLEYRLRF